VVSALEIAAGIVAGSLINLLFSRQASKELRREAERLRRHTNLILRAMHNAGLAEIRWNEHGEPEGLLINLSGVAAGRGGARQRIGTTGGRSRRSLRRVSLIWE
jgi:hypothetical protein